MPKSPSSTEDKPPSIEEQLETIVTYLHHLDRRDRLRTWGSFFRSLLTLIPIALLLWSVWYFVEHGDEFIEQITREAVEQSAAYTQDAGSGLLEQLQQYLPQQ